MDFIRLDKVSARKGGGVAMHVVSEKPLDNSIKTQEYLMDKIELCLDYIKTEEFIRKYPEAETENTWIVLELVEEPTNLMKELFRRIAKWTEFHHARFSWIVNENV